MILLVLVVVLWIVVLTPGALRRRAEHRGAGSIDHFHHQLQLLEHAGPKIVAPAYRLHTAQPGGGTGSLTSPLDVSSRPKLVLLRPTDDVGSADIDGVDGCHYERVGVLDSPAPTVSLSETRAGLAAYRRQQARQRCTILLRCLIGITLTTGIIGTFPSFRLAWIFTGLIGIASLALIGLIGYAREVEAQQSRSRPRPGAEYVDDDSYYRAAASGLPGAWDEEYQILPRQAAGGH